MKTVKSHKKVTTVWLEPDVREGQNWERIFFCFNCRVPLIQYTGTVATVVPGDQPYEPSTILKCKGNVKKANSWEECGQFYCFVASTFTKNPRVE